MENCPHILAKKLSPRSKKEPVAEPGIELLSPRPFSFASVPKDTMQGTISI